MCTVSFIGDQWRDAAPERYPFVQPYIPPTVVTTFGSEVTRAEFEALKADIAALRHLLLAAKEYDAATGQPDCETDEKVALIKRLADLVGVDMTEVFGA